MPEQEERGVRRAAPQSRKSRLSLLAIGLDAQDSALLAGICRQADWGVHIARTYRDAIKTLCYQSIPAILCRSSLPDGDWKDVLSRIAPMTEPPRLIVVSPAAAYLREEVRDLGGYDALATPLNRASVIRTIARASHDWRRSGSFAAGA